MLQKLAFLFVLLVVLPLLLPLVVLSTTYLSSVFFLAEVDF